MANKLILAVISEDDYEAVIAKLQEEGFIATKLSSSGGFLRKKNYTVMIGVDEENRPKVIEILKENSSRRKQKIRRMPMPIAGVRSMDSGASVEMEIDVGGVTVFTLPLDSIEKY